MSQEIMTGNRDLGKNLGLFDLIDRILDKGLVIDAYVSVELLGIKELLVIRARIVVASIETFLRYADAMGLYGEPGTFRAAFPREQSTRAQRQLNELQQEQMQHRLRMQQQLPQPQQILQQLQQLPREQQQQILQQLQQQPQQQQPQQLQQQPQQPQQQQK
jgi:hypothetical protein